METPPVLPPRNRIDRRNAVTLKLLFIAALVLLLLIPLYLVNGLRQERSENLSRAIAALTVNTATASGSSTTQSERATQIFEGYRMVERSLKHGVFVLALVFTAFFLFEILASLRLHLMHYGLVGAALCLFYLALLAVGEIAQPGVAYGIAATASSLLITLYSAAILRSWVRATLIAGLLTVVHTVLFIVLRMEDFALLAGTAALFGALAAVMFFTRHIDWHAEEASVRPNAIPELAK